MNMHSDYNITNALAQLEEATNGHNSTFDEANKIFVDVEESLKRIKTEYWFPYYLSPRTYLAPNSFAPIIPNNLNLQPFNQVTYDLGFSNGRLVIRKVTTEYEYIRNAYQQILFGPNNVPYTNRIGENMETPIPVVDCPRDLRVMVIESLPNFIEFVRSSITTHTNTLNSALGYLKAN